MRMPPNPFTRQAALPRGFAPMLASSGGELPPSGALWTFEPKWDGIRLVAAATAREVRLWTRNGIDRSESFPEVTDALRQMAEDRGAIVLDGEVIALDARGRPSRFGALQGRHQAAAAERPVRTAFVAFDCLADNEMPLVEFPWLVRREVLEYRLSGLPRRSAIQLGETRRGRSETLLRRAHTQGWEGIMAKRVDAAYESGQRSKSWLKLKLEHEDEFVIGGFTAPRRSRSHLGSLLLGYFDGDGALRYAGGVGTGFSESALQSVARRLAPLARATSPFADAPRLEDATWVRPALIAQVRYNEMTEAGRIRQGAFLGLRTDKNPADVRRPNAVLVRTTRM
jgi:bifunctional non-homologous end joining protein LigD